MGSRGPQKRLEAPWGPATADVPDCPDYLAGEARREWERVAPTLHDMGLLTELDVTTLATYCANYGRLVGAERVLADADGLTFDAGKGYMQQRPEIGIANKAAAEMLGALAGCTDLDRERWSTRSL